MLSPAKRHLQKALAAKEAASAQGGQPQSGDLYQLMMAQLAEHRRTLKNIQSVERKIEFKAQHLPEFDAYLDGVLESGSGAQDTVLMYLLIWHLDTGNLDRAMQLAEYALKHDLAMPDAFERTTATVIAEEVADYYLKENHQDFPKIPDWLLKADALTADADMPDQVRAKLHKALGYASREHAPEVALNHLKRALELNDRIGVKKDIDKLEKDLQQS